MTLLPDGPVAHALRRPEIVAARIDAARRLYPSLDVGALGAWLDHHAAPALAAVAPAAPGAVEPVALALLDAAIDIVGRGLIGGEHALVGRAWSEVLPAAAHLLPGGPELPAALANAAWNLVSQPRTRGETWVERLAAAAPRCASPAELRTAALVLAWRAGLAHYRDAARRGFASLPAPLAGHLVSEPDLAADELARLFDHPWVPPSMRHLPRRLSLVGRLGGFRGFGGSFVRPPVVSRVEGQFVGWDAEGAVLLHADAYGDTCRRLVLPPAPPCGPGDSFTLDPAGLVTHAGASRAFPVLAGSRSAAGDAHTLLVTLPHSHHVYVVALAPDRREGGA